MSFIQFIIPKSKKTYLFILAAVFLLLLMGMFLFRAWVIAEFKKDLLSQNNNTVFYDIEGQPFHLIRGSEDRKYIPLHKISKNLLKAVVAVEDARYFQHFGFDPIRLGGAVFHAVNTENELHGASTITQQLVKLSLLTPERTFSRKAKEFFMAIALESYYSKEQLLEFYLNKVYLGHRNYGVENACLNYFHKSASELSLAEAAFIAGLIKKPEGYSPFSNLKGARMRQLVTLKRMKDLGWINPNEHREAVNERILIRQKKQSDLQMAPYYTNHVLTQLQENFKPAQIWGGGLRVYTTLNRADQQAMETVIKARLQEVKSFSEIAGVSLEPSTGFVTALVGGADFDRSEFNRVTQSLRQPGSSFKPILYATALSQGIKPTDTVMDEPISYPNQMVDGIMQFYEPTNYENRHFGRLTVADALRRSNNIVSIRLLERIGIPKLVTKAHQFGIDLPKKRGLCLALGCGEVSLLQLTRAYGVFANSGNLNEPVFILKVTDSNGNILYQHQPKPEVRVLTPEVAYQVNRLLQNVMQAGTGVAAKIDNEAGGKTGTTNEHKDAWFIGFTADRVAGFWVGNDDNTPMLGEVGGGTPAKLWKGYFNGLPQPKQPKVFSPPGEFEDYLICTASGKQANAWCPDTVWLPLASYQAPHDTCDVHDQPPADLMICKDSKKLVGPYCPPERQVLQRFLAEEQPSETCDVHTTWTPASDPSPATDEDISP